MDGAKRSLDECLRSGRDGSGSFVDLQWWQVFKDLHLGLALLATASPARAPQPGLDSR
jgi:hypothetical protein